MQRSHSAYISEKPSTMEDDVRPGADIRTSDRVRTPEGFLPPDTVGKVIVADSENTCLIEFTDVEIEIGVGHMKKVTTRASVLIGYFYEIPAARARKPLW